LANLRGGWGSLQRLWGSLTCHPTTKGLPWIDLGDHMTLHPIVDGEN